MFLFNLIEKDNGFVRYLGTYRPNETVFLKYDDLTGTLKPCHEGTYAQALGVLKHLYYF